MWRYAGGQIQYDHKEWYGYGMEWDEAVYRQKSPRHLEDCSRSGVGKMPLTFVVLALSVFIATFLPGFGRREAYTLAVKSSETVVKAVEILKIGNFKLDQSKY
ncbi:hypothetical protein Trydic_g17357 [Trypoxylus dichotomus]